MTHMIDESRGELKKRIEHLQALCNQQQTLLCALGTRGLSAPDGSYVTTITAAEVAGVRRPNTRWEVNLAPNDDGSAFVLTVREFVVAAPPQPAALVQVPTVQLPR